MNSVDMHILADLVRAHGQASAVVEVFDSGIQTGKLGYQAQGRTVAIPFKLQDRRGVTADGLFVEPTDNRLPTKGDRVVFRLEWEGGVIGYRIYSWWFENEQIAARMLRKR